MLRLWKAKHILVCSIASVLGIGLAYGQTYPNFNGGNLTNNNPPPTGGPSQQIIQMPSGTSYRERVAARCAGECCPSTGYGELDTEPDADIRECREYGNLSERARCTR
jgi:hypothetical protein